MENMLKWFTKDFNDLNKTWVKYILGFGNNNALVPMS